MQSAQAEPQVLITRSFKAPREKVFKAWIDRAALPNWFAPSGCTVEFKKLDVRTGGSFHSCIHAGGKDCWCVGDYKEVVPNERLVFTMAIANEKGERLDAITAGMDPAWPAETTVTVTFVERNGVTQITLQQTVSEALAKKTGAHPSWLSMFDRLEAQLAKA